MNIWFVKNCQFLFILFILVILYFYFWAPKQMIRLISMTIGGRAYLNFMGNEFGHPEVRLLAPTCPINVFIWLMIVLCSRGLSSQCQATISLFHLPIEGGIFLPTRDCIATCLPLIRCQLIPICYPEMLHLVVFWLCNCSDCCRLLKVV